MELEAEERMQDNIVKKRETVGITSRRPSDTFTQNLQHGKSDSAMEKRIEERVEMKPGVEEVAKIRPVKSVSMQVQKLVLLQLDIEGPCIQKKIIAKLLKYTIPKPQLSDLDLEKRISVLKPPLRVVNIGLHLPKLIELDGNIFKACPSLAKIAYIKIPKTELKELDRSTFITVSRIDEMGDLFEAFFEPVEVEEEHDLRLAFASSAYDRPIIIVVRKPGIKKAEEVELDEIITILLYAAREMYRTSSKGLPWGAYISEDEVEEVKRAHLLQDVVRVIELSKLNLGKDSNLNKTSLKNRLRELIPEGLSITILYADEDIFKELKSVIGDGGEFGADVYYVIPRKLSYEQRYRLSALTWGFLNMINEPMPIIRGSNTFARFAELFYKNLRRIYIKAIDIASIVKPSEEQESSLHYYLKVFTAYYFIKKKQLSQENVCIEEKICEYIPDIYVKPLKIAIEIETLYGTAMTWAHKLRQTIEKYRGCDVISEIWLIIPPLQASMLLKFILRLAKKLEKKISKKVRIATIDLRKEEIIDLIDIGKEIKNVLKQASS
jgi:hypothetical protein